MFDTTFLVDAERSGSDLGAAIDDDDDVAIAAITAAELGVGVELATGRARSRRNGFLDDVLAAIPVIDYGIVVARAHATLLAEVRRQGRARGAHDLVIAATALATQRVVLTADQTGFADLPGVIVRQHR